MIICFNETTPHKHHSTDALAKNKMLKPIPKSHIFEFISKQLDMRVIE